MISETPPPQPAARKRRSVQARTLRRLRQQTRQQQEIIAHLSDELVAKEKVIQQIRVQRLFSPLFLLHIILERTLPILVPVLHWLVAPIARCYQLLDRWTSVRLGVLNQHPPVTLTVPESYYQPAKSRAPLPTISMVTPSFNQGQFIERTLQSVLSQGYPKLEFVVQDGGSTDATADVLAKYRDQLTHVESRRDNGQAHAVQLGFERTSGEVMAYLNSDDLLLPGSLHYVASYFAAHPSVDVVYGHRILIDEQDREIGRWIMPPHDDEVLSWADYIPQETLFWRRSIWEKAGGCIDTTMQFALDWELILRFREAGATFVRLPRFLGAFRVHVSQKTSTQFNSQGYMESTALRKRCLGRVVSEEQIAAALRGYLLRHIIEHNSYRLQTRFSRAFTPVTAPFEPR